MPLFEYLNLALYCLFLEIHNGKKERKREREREREWGIELKTCCDEIKVSGAGDET